MKLLEVGTNTELVDFTDTVKVRNFTPQYIDATGQRSRRSDAALVSDDGRGYKAELTFELQRLTAADIDTLEGIYRDSDPFICVPEVESAPEKVYLVRWESPFDRRDTVETNWSLGRSLTVVFREV